MKAKITSAEKRLMPSGNQDNEVLMVAVGVDFMLDTGELYYHQEYAVLPEVLADYENPADYFQKQADAMQNDLNHTAANAGNIEAAKQADDIISKLAEKI